VVANASVTGRAAAGDDHEVAGAKGEEGLRSPDHLVGDEEGLIVRERSTRAPASRGERAEGEIDFSDELWGGIGLTEIGSFQI
jgi:hypothetical protein